jgi:hypothetical protein
MSVSCIGESFDGLTAGADAAALVKTIKLTYLVTIGAQPSDRLRESLRRA